MVSASGQLIQLENGRHIAISEYGEPTGAPVFFCHGWPSSRTMAALTDEAARDLGLRIISPDRPGIYQTPFQQDRQLLDWPKMMGELSARLAIGRFRMLGISGGAPYALATAWALPSQVEAIAVVSGAPPISELTEREGLLRIYRWMLALYGRRPELLRRCFSFVRPFASIRVPVRLRPWFLKILQPCDAEALREARAFEACFESARQAWRASANGIVADAEIYARPWGFVLEEVTVPVRLWHGKMDRTFSYRLAQQIAARLPNCEAHFIEGAGHYSLAIRHIRDILADLKSA